MLRFNTLLRAEAIDPADVKLVRHQDNRFPGRPTPYDLWRKDVASFETYQRIQRRAVFSDARFLASFVGTTDNDTLFVGEQRKIPGIGNMCFGKLGRCAHIKDWCSPRAFQKVFYIDRFDQNLRLTRYL